MAEEVKEETPVEEEKPAEKVEEEKKEPEPADCLLSWRYTYLESRAEYVMAGLPVRQTFPDTPKVDDVLTFRPILTANYGLGTSTSQKEVSAKVVSIEKSSSNKYDYNVVLEVIYQ